MSEMRMPIASMTILKLFYTSIDPYKQLYCKRCKNVKFHLLVKTSKMSVRAVSVKKTTKSFRKDDL
jgi:hypothetical protein